MAEFPASILKKRRKVAGWAWLALAAGGSLLLYSLLQMGDAGIPGWQPAGERLRAVMEASSSSAAPSFGAAPATASAPSAGVPPASAAAAESEPKSSAVGMLDLNKASETELDALPGIGPSKAKAIVAYRDSRKGFRSAEELLEVKGIGPKIFEELRGLVIVTVPGAAP